MCIGIRLDSDDLNNHPQRISFLLAHSIAHPRLIESFTVDHNLWRHIRTHLSSSVSDLNKLKWILCRYFCYEEKFTLTHADDNLYFFLKRVAMCSCDWEWVLWRILMCWKNLYSSRVNGMGGNSSLTMIKSSN